MLRPPAVRISGNEFLWVVHQLSVEISTYKNFYTSPTKMQDFFCPWTVVLLIFAYCVFWGKISKVKVYPFGLGVGKRLDAETTWLHWVANPHFGDNVNVEPHPAPFGMVETISWMGYRYDKFMYIYIYTWYRDTSRFYFVANIHPSTYLRHLSMFNGILYSFSKGLLSN